MVYSEKNQRFGSFNFDLHRTKWSSLCDYDMIYIYQQETGWALNRDLSLRKCVVMCNV